MKKTLLHSLRLLSFFVALAAMAVLSSCSNTKYTASFQKSPEKTYSQLPKDTPSSAPAFEEPGVISEVAENSIEVPKDLAASLSEAGISEKKSNQIQKRIEKLTESIENSNANTTATPHKLNFAERMAVKAALKKADKILKENSIKDSKEVKETKRTKQMNKNIRIGLILLLVGLLLGFFIPYVGGIVAIVGIVFLIIGLVEMA